MNNTAYYNPAARDEDELEGTLLLPVATRINTEPSNRHDSVSYATAIADEHSRQHRLQQQQQQMEDVAYPLPRHEAAISDDSYSRVKLAERKGKIASEEEKEAIRNVNRTAYSTNYFSSHAVEAANRRARIRDADGLQVVDRETLSSPQHTREDGINEVPMTGTSEAPSTTKAGGYEVNEYSVKTDYKMSEYETHEYRSVYE